MTNWLWKFGDGGSSSEQNPSHTYAKGGSYKVSLTVTGPGGSNTKIRNQYIKVKNVAPPVPNFKGTPVTGKAPLKVKFTDSSTGEITGWSWDFGDGGKSTEKNPTHTYTDPGTYTVSLTVTGPGGSKTKTLKSYIKVKEVPPAADFQGSPTSGKKPLTVRFEDTSTGNITSWLWDFGDGGKSSKQNPVHVYRKTGSFTVKLTVAGPGGTSTKTKTRYIKVTNK